MHDRRTHGMRTRYLMLCASTCSPRAHDKLPASLLDGFFSYTNRSVKTLSVGASRCCGALRQRCADHGKVRSNPLSPRSSLRWLSSANSFFSSVSYIHSFHRQKAWLLCRRCLDWMPFWHLCSPYRQSSKPINTMVKVVMWSRGGGARLTKPGWSKPHTHSTPN